MTLDMSVVERDLERWVMEVLDVPHAALNGVSPCPFARQAWLSRRYRLAEAGDLLVDLLSTPDAWEEGCDLVIYVFDPASQVDPIWLADTARTANLALMERGFMALEGHPDIPESVLDCDMNQGRYAYAIVQPLDKLSKGRASLVGRGYYDNWPREMLEQIVEIREKKQ